MPQAKPRLYRDPVHDTIAFAPDTPEGQLVIRLLDTREVQRSTGPAACPQPPRLSRRRASTLFSLPVVWLASQMLERLGACGDLERVAPIDAILCALARRRSRPHALEGVCGFTMRRASDIVRDPDTEVHQVLSEVDPSFPSASRRCTAPPNSLLSSTNWSRVSSTRIAPITSFVMGE